MKNLKLLFVLAVAISLSACTMGGQSEEKPTDLQREETTQISNPASENCVKNDGKLEIRQNEDGSEYGVCVFEDGTECEEWALFTGKCTEHPPLMGVSGDENFSYDCATVDPEYRNQCCAAKMQDVATLIACEWKYDETINDCECFSEEDPNDFGEDRSQKLTEEFITNAPTYAYDGSNLKYRETIQLRCEGCWEFVYYFNSSQGGYGDRTGQAVSQIETNHEVVAQIEKGVITKATIDNTWDMLTQTTLNQNKNSRAEEIPNEEISSKVEEYIEKSITYTERESNQLKHVKTEVAYCEGCYNLTYSFVSTYSGYGELGDQVVVPDETEHEIRITLNENEIESAVIDQIWDEINQKELKSDPVGLSCGDLPLNEQNDCCAEEMKEAEHSRCDGDWLYNADTAQCEYKCEYEQEVVGESCGAVTPGEEDDCCAEEMKEVEHPRCDGVWLYNFDASECEYICEYNLGTKCVEESTLAEKTACCAHEMPYQNILTPDCIGDWIFSEKQEKCDYKCSEENEAAQNGNPASDFCILNGGKSEIIQKPDGGSSGICIFEDGSECEEWAYFRGECSPESN